MRVSLLAVVMFGASCSRRAAPGQIATVVDTAFVFVADSSMQGGKFPQVSGSSRILPNGSVRAAGDAPLCSLDFTSITSGWDEVQTPIETRYFKAVALRLPPGFKPTWFSHRRDPDDDDPEEKNADTEYWGHLLGSWESVEEGADDFLRRPHFTIWIGPNEGYPTSSIGGAEVKQVGFSECRVENSLGLVPVALFEVQSSSAKLGGFHVITYAQVQPGVYIRAIGNARDSASQTLLLATVATMRIIR